MARARTRVESRGSENAGPWWYGRVDEVPGGLAEQGAEVVVKDGQGLGGGVGADEGGPAQAGEGECLCTWRTWPE